MSKPNKARRREIRGRVNHELAGIVQNIDLTVGGNFDDLNEEESRYAQQVRDDIANAMAATADRVKDKISEEKGDEEPAE